jgi:Zn-dependent M32 family carboxypeptidase
MVMRMSEELEELVKKIKAKDLNAEAKKRGIKTHCVKKLDIAKQLPREVVEELSAKSQ